jgi:hypothetical protein
LTRRDSLLSGTPWLATQRVTGTLAGSGCAAEVAGACSSGQSGGVAGGRGRAVSGGAIAHGSTHAYLQYELPGLLVMTVVFATAADAPLGVAALGPLQIGTGNLQITCPQPDSGELPGKRGQICRPAIQPARRARRSWRAK